MAPAWLVAFAAVGAVAIGGCVYSPETTVKVRDPSGVQVDVDDEGNGNKGGTRTVLAPAATASEAPVPATSPPFEEGLRPSMTFRRLAGGPIDITCADCSPRTATLVESDGTIAFGPKITIARQEWTKGEMRIRFRDRREVTFGSYGSYTADVATPWSNVAEVRRVSTPSRALGIKLLLSAGVAAALGIFSLQDGLSLHHTTTTAFGGVLLPLSAILAIGGGWYAFAPPSEQVLFGETHGTGAK